nr:hypothetical protein [uncultured Campylobacter sp.]
MIEQKPDLATLATAVNLSPINSPRKTGKFATDFYGKFDGESLRAAAKSVKFKNKTQAKTLASPQIKFGPSTSQKRELFSLTNLTAQTARTANQARVNSARSGASKQTSNLASNLTKRP